VPPCRAHSAAKLGIINAHAPAVAVASVVVSSVVADSNRVPRRAQTVVRLALVQLAKFLSQGYATFIRLAWTEPKIK
jgi:hypothetical protein